MVENHRKSLGIIRENMTLLKIGEGYKIFPLDAFKYIETFKGEPYDLVIADPPFTQAWAHDLCVKIGECPVLKSGGTFVVEASSKERMDENYPGLIRLVAVYSVIKT